MCTGIIKTDDYTSLYHLHRVPSETPNVVFVSTDLIKINGYVILHSIITAVYYFMS